MEVNKVYTYKLWYLSIEINVLRLFGSIIIAYPIWMCMIPLCHVKDVSSMGGNIE